MMKSDLYAALVALLMVLVGCIWAVIDAKRKTQHYSGAVAVAIYAIVIVGLLLSMLDRS